MTGMGPVGPVLGLRRPSSKQEVAKTGSGRSCGCQVLGGWAVTGRGERKHRGAEGVNKWPTR